MKTRQPITVFRAVVFAIALAICVFALSWIPQRVNHTLDAYEYRVSDPSDGRATNVTIDGWLQTPLFFPATFRGTLLVGGYEQLAQVDGEALNLGIQFHQSFPKRYDGSITYYGHAPVTISPVQNSLGFLRIMDRMKRVYIGILEPVGPAELADGEWSWQSFDGTSGLVVLAPAKTLEEAQALSAEMIVAPK